MQIKKKIIANGERGFTIPEMPFAFGIAILILFFVLMFYLYQRPHKTHAQLSYSIPTARVLADDVKNHADRRICFTCNYES